MWANGRHRGICTSALTVPADATKDASVRAFFRITNVATGAQYTASAAASQTVAGASTATLPAPRESRLPDGQYRVAAMACSNDVGGWRCSTYTAERSVTIDATPPAVPTLTMREGPDKPTVAVRVNTYWYTDVVLPPDATGFTYEFTDVATGAKSSGTKIGSSTLQIAYSTPGRYPLVVQAFDRDQPLRRPGAAG